MEKFKAFLTKQNKNHPEPFKAEKKGEVVELNVGEETTQAASGVVDHSTSMGKKLKKNKKPAEEGTPELVRRYRKSTPGESVKEAHSVGGYKARAVGSNTTPSDRKGVPLGTKRPVVQKTSTQTSTVDGKQVSKTTTKSVSGGFKGRARKELKVGSDDKTTKR